MEFTPLESNFFGSGVVWLLLTFPAYWIFQWTVEGEPFHVWRRAAKAVTRANEVWFVVTQALVEAGTTLSTSIEPEASQAEVALTPVID